MDAIHSHAHGVLFIFAWVREEKPLKACFETIERFSINQPFANPTSQVAKPLVNVLVFG